MPKLDPTQAPVKTGSIYPAPYDAMMEGRTSLRMGDWGGLTQFGVNLVRLAPGAMSSLRHWHLREDEFVMVTQGTCTLIDDHGHHTMHPGDCAAFPAGDQNGHHFINETNAPAEFLVVGTRHAAEVATYSDVDLKVTMTNHVPTFTYKDNTPYAGERK